MKTALHNIQYKTFFGNGTKNSSARQICRQYVNTALERTPDADYFTKSVTGGKMNFQGCNCNGLDSFTLKDFHNKKDKLEISEYITLNEAEKSEIRSETWNYIEKFTDETIDYALKFKEGLDNAYGEGEYVFCSIGTSPSLIGKVLECTGVETRYLPITGLGRGIPENCNLENYFAFLDSQGISPEKVSGSGKKYIFCDYTSHGLTLKNYAIMMTEKLGLPKGSIFFRSINKSVEDLGISEQCAKNYEHYLFDDIANTFTSVTHLTPEMFESKDLNRESLGWHNRKTVKLFNFLVMDKIHRMGLLKENPDNKGII